MKTRLMDLLRGSSNDAKARNKTNQETQGDVRQSHSMRTMSAAEAAGLRPGADHYRAFVGPPARYGFLSLSQLSLLFALGLREEHSVLDFGCGSLRLGRLLIPFLAEKKYHGIDPNAWLIEEGFQREVGDSIRTLKKPRFSHNEDFNCDVFEEQFDFIVAQSIITHSGPAMTRALLTSASRCLKPNGLFVASFFLAQPESAAPPEGWKYPGCVEYPPQKMDELASEAGLIYCMIPWFHPGCEWGVFALDQAHLPDAEALGRFMGKPLRGDVQ